MTPQEAVEKKMSWHDVAKTIIPEISEDDVTRILWNDTCYPFDDETAFNQLIKYLQEIKNKL